MDVRLYFDIKRKVTQYCNKGDCSTTCPLHIMNNGMHVSCKVLEFDYPEIADKIMKDSLKTLYPYGYVICAKSGKCEDIFKCSKYESCTECEKENL